MRKWTKFISFGLLAFALPLACMASDSLASANEFLELIRTGKYELAAREFEFPASYTPAELEAETSDIKSTLFSLFRATGEMQNIPKSENGLYATLTFGIKAGDAAHPLPASNPSMAAGFHFVVPFKRYPDAAINLDLERVGEIWKVRELKFALPATDSSSPTRIRSLFSEVIAAKKSQQNVAK